MPGAGPLKMAAGPLGGGGSMLKQLGNNAEKTLAEKASTPAKKEQDEEKPTPIEENVPFEEVKQEEAPLP